MSDAEERPGLGCVKHGNIHCTACSEEQRMRRLEHDNAALRALATKMHRALTDMGWSWNPEIEAEASRLGVGEK